MRSENSYARPEKKLASLSPWKRGRPEHRSFALLKRQVHSIELKFDANISVNMDLDNDTKIRAQQASPFVVSLVSSTCNNVLSMCSGTIIKSKGADGSYVSTIMTSASLIRSSSTIDDLPHDIKIEVYMWDKTKLEGQICYYDFHYNLATVKVKGNAPLPTAILRHSDDSISIDPFEDTSEHAESYRRSACPGDKVIALGRYFKEKFEVMAACGVYCVDCCDLDCKELLTTNCKITKCGIGGPLINLVGEVIGVNFYNDLCTPFLPINIVFGCIDYFKKYRRCSRPSIGMDMTNLYMASLNTLESIVFKFSNITKGVLVEEVTPGSAASYAGILPGDVIFKCGNKVVQSLLELFEMLLHKVGKSVKLSIIRESNDVPLKLTMFVSETTPDNFNRWPLPEKRWQRVESYR